MRRLFSHHFPVFLVQLCIAPPTALAQARTARLEHATAHTTTTRRADSTAVARTVAQFLHAFNDLDWETFRGYFADDATVFLPLSNSPLRKEGRTEFESAFQGFFHSVRAAGNGPPYLHIQPKDVRIQMLGDAAVVSFHLRNDGAPQVGRRTLVMRKEANGRWKIAHLHASSAELPKERRGSPSDSSGTAHVNGIDMYYEIHGAGDQDEFFPLEVQLGMYRAIPGAELWIVPEAGHAPRLAGSYRSEFLEITTDFLHDKVDAMSASARPR